MSEQLYRWVDKHPDNERTELRNHWIRNGIMVPAEPNYEAAADAYLASKKALTPPSEATILIGVEMRHIVAAVDAALGEPA